jgi:NitT/TauT family transport system substrate-binding protein
VGFAPVFVASEEHFFSQRGLTVEALPILDTAQRTTAFASGRVDAICTTLDSLLLTGTKGVDLVIVFAVDESKGADGILTSPSIRKPTDLKGKRVAFQEAMPSHFLLLWYLNANGMNADDVQRINMNADDAGAAFIAGKVDAAVTWEPWLSRAKEAGKGRLLTSTADLPGVLVDVLAVRRAVLVNRPEAVQALYAGWMDAIDFYNKSPDVAVSVMSKNLKLDEKEVRLNASTLLFADRSFNNQFFKRDAKDSAWTLAAQAVKIWQGAGLMPAGQNSDQFISDQIVKGPVRK